MTRAEALDLGRDSLRRQAWGDAFARLSGADHEAPLDPEDLQHLAIAAHLIGREAEGGELLARAHQAFLGAGDARRASRCAFWLGFTLLYDGDLAQGGGWLARAARVLDGQDECVERGYLLLPAGFRSIQEGDALAGHAAFAGAADIGRRFGDADLVALALNGQGRALVRQGQTARGVGFLDEAMVSVTSGEVSPIVAGIVYCSVIASCQETLDLRRAQEWTAALTRWCEAQPDLVPYRGHCLLHRAEILQLRGAWSDALEQAERARERLSERTLRSAVGGALYRVAEIHRLRGAFAEAEEAYRQAGPWSQACEPGPALLRLAQGDVATAQAAIGRLAAEAVDGGTRSRILDAQVEIALAARDVPAARIAADELSAIAERHDAPLLDAMAARAKGAVLLAEANANGALVALRHSLHLWRDLEAPYEAARTQVLIALACRDLGDEASADLDLQAACETFRRLGAAADITRVQVLAAGGEHPAAGPLSPREVEVIRLVASGATNRDIAARLGISEKTVARHMSNIFVKIGVSSRAAATAYAYKNALA